MKTNNKGFSLVELIVVIAIMAILAAVAIPTFAGFITKANEAADRDFIASVEQAIKLANAAEGTVSEIEVTGESGEAWSKITYKVTPTGATEAIDVEITKQEDSTSIYADDDKDLEDCAKMVVETIDSDYKFKTKDVRTSTKPE
jgi:type IV pilus assembly protein PilA